MIYRRINRHLHMASAPCKFLWRGQGSGGAEKEGLKPEINVLDLKTELEVGIRKPNGRIISLLDGIHKCVLGALFLETVEAFI